jgi:hypothetical protein
MVKSESLVVADAKKAEINKRVVDATLNDKGHTKKLSN